MKRIYLNLLFALFMLVTIVGAVNYDYLYNPYTGMQDRSNKVNQTGENLTATRFLAEDGSVTIPSFSFTAQNTTGMYRIGNADLGFTTTGTLVFEILKSGIVSYQNITIASGKVITTKGAGNITLLPNSTGYTIIGDAGQTNHGLNTNDDLFVSGVLEIDGQTFLDNQLTASSNLIALDSYGFYVGSSTDSGIIYSTVQTPNAPLWLLGSESNSLLFVEKADVSTNFNHSLQTNPTLFVQSADATTVADWVSLSHDQANAQIQSGSGDINLNPAGANVNVTSHNVTNVDCLKFKSGGMVCTG